MSSTMQNKASLPVIKRLPKYYRYLSNLQADGRDKISSSELARMMGTTASQVRQDFNCFGGFGQQGTCTARTGSDLCSGKYRS